MNRVSRYHPLLVVLHWTLAVLIIGALTAGFLLLEPMPNSDPQKIGILRVHMVVGITILALMIVRFIVRITTSRPEDASTGYPLLDRVGRITHYAFYVIVILMVATGYTTAVLTDLPAIAFGGSGKQLPSSFETYPSFLVHGSLAAILVGFIGLHVLAAVYHQFVKKDGLLQRMWFG
jgi:cytochrome b561